MEKRVVIAVILSIVVLYGYSYIFPPPKKETVAPVSSAQIQPVAVNVVKPAPARTDNTLVRDIVVDTD